MKSIIALVLASVALSGCAIVPAYPPGVYVGPPRVVPGPYSGHRGYRGHGYPGYYGHHRHYW